MLGVCDDGGCVEGRRWRCLHPHDLGVLVVPSTLSLASPLYLLVGGSCGLGWLATAPWVGVLPKDADTAHGVQFFPDMYSLVALTSNAHENKKVGALVRVTSCMREVIENCIRLTRLSAGTDRTPLHLHVHDASSVAILAHAGFCLSVFFSRPPTPTQGEGTCGTRPEKRCRRRVLSPSWLREYLRCQVPSASPPFSTSLWESPSPVDWGGWPRHRVPRSWPTTLTHRARRAVMPNMYNLVTLTSNTAHENKKIGV